jgi:hypothetical protein
VFHLTAITRRRDALFQTTSIGGKWLAYRHGCSMAAHRGDNRALGARCAAAGSARHAPGRRHIRCGSLRQRVPGEARNAIAAVPVRSPM